MRRTTICMMLLAAATIIVAMFLMPVGRSSEYGSTCGLRYGSKVDGVVRSPDRLNATSGRLNAL